MEIPVTTRRYGTDLQQEGFHVIPRTTSHHGACNCLQFPREQQHMLPGKKEISLFIGLVIVVGILFMEGTGEMAT